MTSVYKLIDPRDGSVRYVGLARNPEKRYGQPPIRLRGRGSLALQAWEKELAAVGHYITLEIIEVVPDDKGIERERFWIRHHSAVSPLLCNVREHLSGTKRKDKLVKITSIAVSSDEMALIDNLLATNRNFRSRNDLVRRCLHFGLNAILLGRLSPANLHTILKEARSELLEHSSRPDLMDVIR